MAWLWDGGSRDRGAWGSLRVSCTAARLLGMQLAWATGGPPAQPPPPPQDTNPEFPVSNCHLFSKLVRLGQC